MAGTIYVDSAGNAGTVNPKAVDHKLIRDMKERSSAARNAARATTAAPAAPVVNDTIANPPGPGPLQRTITKARSGFQAARNTLNAAGPLKSGIAARALATGAALAAPVEGALQDDATARYAQRFGVAEPTGDGSAGDVAKFIALRAGGAATDVANGLTLGLAGRFYRDADRPAAPSAVAPVPTAAAQPTGTPAMPTAQAAPPAPAIALGPIAARRQQARANIVQDGPASFTDGASPPLPERPMSAQNQQAFDNLGAQGAAETRAYMAMQEQPDGIDYGALGSDVSNLQQLGFNRRERMAILSGAGLTDTVSNRSISQRSRQAQLQGVETKNRGAAIETQQAENVSNVLTRLLELNDQNDPGGVERAQIHQNLRAMGINKSSTAETPEERYLREITKAAYGDGMRSPEEAQSIIEQQMRAYRNGSIGVPTTAAPAAGANVTVDPSQQAPQPGAQFQEGKVYVDANGNRAKFQNGQWVEV